MARPPIVRRLAGVTYGETTGGAANTWTNYTNAGGTQGPTIPAYATIQITCALTGFRVADGNTWWYLIASSPWNNSYYVSADAFYNNGATSGSLLGTPFVDPAVPNCSTVTGGTNETTGGAANTWTDYSNAGGTQGPTIGAFQTVQIACAVTGFRVADGNTWWYRIASAPWTNTYYVSADAFYNNGATSGSLRGTPFVDQAVPLCSSSSSGGGSPGGGASTGETTGGAANTWTNYANAGGTQGPTIGAFTTVQIACKVTGFRVADGNTWWYLIASAPWNSSYYVSADAFYNNGTTSGSLLGTPFVDSSVPDCANGTRPSGETAGGNANTWANYTHAGGAQGPTISSGTTVQVACRVTGFAVADGNTWWYLIGSAPWNGVYYASADAFYNNGTTSGGLQGTPFVDTAVPVCVNNQEAPIFTTAVGSASSSSHASVHVTGCQRADPVNCASGDYSETITDVSVPGRGPGIELTRTYNDLAAASTGLFGHGWSSTYDQHLGLNGDGSITATLADGSQLTATPNGSGGFTVPASADSSLQANSDGTYTLTQRSTRLLTFSSAGRLLSLRDLNGYTTVLAYDGSGHLTSVTDAAGRVLQVVVGSSGFVSSVMDPAGAATSYAYDGAGNLVSVTDSLGRVTHYDYDSNHLMLTMTDPRGGTVKNTYDSQGRVTSQTDPAARTTSFAYTGDNFSSLGGTTTITDPRGDVEVEQYVNGFLTTDVRASGTAAQATWQYTYDPSTFGVTSMTDPNGHVTGKTYDSGGRVLTSTDPLGNVTAYTYNSLGEMVTSTSPLNETAKRSYDSRGNLLTVVDPLGNTTTYSYGDATHPGDVTAITDPNGNSTTYSYDGAGDRTSVTDPLGHTTTMTYDADGRILTVTTPRGNATGADAAAYTSHDTYDAAGELIKKIDALGYVTTYTYDPDGNRTSVTDALGHTTSYTYDAVNERTQTTFADGTTTQTSYDTDGNIATHTDEKGHTTTYTYDAQNRRTSTTDADGRTTSYAYDAAGNLITTTDASGRTSTRTYDADNRLIDLRYSDGITHEVTESYDGDGRRVQMSDGSGTTSWTFDAAGHLTAETNGAGLHSAYGYDHAGNITAITYPNGSTATRAYDSANRLTSVSDWLGHTSTFTYDADGNVIQVQLPGSAGETMTYDANDQIASITHTIGSATFEQFTYSRNADGQVTSVVASGAGGDSHTYAYDPRGRLTQDNADAFSYDAAGNPIVYSGGRTQTFDPADALLSSTPAPSTGTGSGGASSGSGGASSGSSSGGAGGASSGSSSGIAGSSGSNSGGSGNGGSNSGGGNSNGAGTTNEGNGSPPVPPPPPAAATRPVTPDAITTVTIASGSGSATITVPKNAVSSSATITVSEATRPAASVTFVADTTAVEVSVTSVDGPLTKFAQPLDLSFPGAPHSCVPAYSENGSIWTEIPSVPNPPTLPAGWPDGAYRDSSGALHVLTLHATYFGLLTGTSPVEPALQLTLEPSKTAIDLRHQRTLSVIVASTLPGSGSLTLTRARKRLARWTISLTTAPATHRLRLPRDAQATGTETLHLSASIGGETATATTRLVLSHGSAVSKRHTEVARKRTRNLANLSNSDYTFSYDAEGDREQIAAAGGTTTTLVYDQMSRLTTVSGGTTYGYDGDGLRMTKTVGTNTTTFAWDETTQPAALLQDGSTSYLYGPRGMPVEQITGSTASYFLHDEQGSTRALIDSSGNIVATYSYDAWGATTAHTGTGSTNLQYGGQFADAETGFLYLRARYYDPATGQFLTIDPLTTATAAPYAYAADDPLDAGDPSGTFCLLGHSHGPNSACRGTNVANDIHAVGTGAGVAAVAGAGIALAATGVGAAADVGFLADAATYAGLLGSGAGLLGGGADCVDAAIGNGPVALCAFDVATGGAGFGIDRLGSQTASNAWTVITGVAGQVLFSESNPALGPDAGTSASGPLCAASGAALQPAGSSALLQPVASSSYLQP